jgi:hypothetical protein
MEALADAKQRPGAEGTRNEEASGRSFIPEFALGIPEIIGGRVKKVKK